MSTLVWFRNDLRVRDNPALYHARERGPVAALFCVCAVQWRQHDVGDHRLSFLLDSLHALHGELAALGIPLEIADTPRFDAVPQAVVNAARTHGARCVAFNEEYPLNERKRDSHVIRACEDAGIRTDVHHAGTILPPGSVLTGNGDPYTVFTPFRKRWLSLLDRSAQEPLAKPKRQRAAGSGEAARGRVGLGRGLPQTIDGVARGAVAERFPAGEKEAAARLQRFLLGPAERYQTDRDFPAIDGTSTLSPYLAVGAISARQCLHAALQANRGRPADGTPGLSTWVTELIWRDFYRHVVALFPHVSRGQGFRTETDALAWRHDPEDLAAWQEGRTGYPLVDAGMRQLNATGWMHNRLRMITAMFLSKHLLLDWRLGERWFMNKLVDGDFAANNGGWQWSASTGTDAAPYFRIFNPYTQARRFDPEGRFIRRWVPELETAPDRSLFDPDKYPVSGYPRPMVDHREARQRALEAFKSLKT